MTFIRLFTRWLMLWSIPILLTIIVGYFSWQIAVPQVSNCWAEWTAETAPTASNDSVTEISFNCMSPNEIGDFLAGSFAPLAFVWLAFAVVLQSLELSAQRKELELTRGVAKEQQLALAEQAKTMSETARLNREQRARGDLNTLVEIVRNQLQTATGFASSATRAMSDMEYMNRNGKRSVTRCQCVFDREDEHHDYQGFIGTLRELKRSAYGEIVAIKNDLGSYDLALYERYGFPELVELLEAVADTEDAKL